MLLFSFQNCSIDEFKFNCIFFEFEFKFELSNFNFSSLAKKTKFFELEFKFASLIPIHQFLSYKHILLHIRPLLCVMQPYSAQHWHVFNF